MSSAAEGDFEESNKEFLPENVVSIQHHPVHPNTSKDEFDLDDDSRKLSIDQSFSESQPSDNGKYHSSYYSHAK